MDTKNNAAGVPEGKCPVENCLYGDCPPCMKGEFPAPAEVKPAGEVLTDERAMFEMESRGFLDLTPSAENGSYMAYSTYCAWRAWQARAALATHSGAEVPSDTYLSGALATFNELMPPGSLSSVGHANVGKAMQAVISFLSPHIARCAQYSPKEVPTRDDVLEEAARLVEDYNAEAERDDGVSFNEIALKIRALKSAAAPIAASAANEEKGAAA